MNGISELNFKELNANLFNEIEFVKEAIGMESKTYKILSLFSNYPSIGKTSEELWWDKVFEGYKYNPSSIGFFNLVGYSSLNSDSINSKVLNMPTTKVLLEYLNILIKNDALKLVILIWGKQKWKNSSKKLKTLLLTDLLSGKYNKKRLIIVNELNSRNKMIKNVNSFDKILDELKLKSIYKL